MSYNISALDSLERVNNYFEAGNLFAYSLNKQCELKPVYGGFIGYAISYILLKLSIRTNQDVAVRTSLTALKVLKDSLNTIPYINRHSPEMQQIATKIQTFFEQSAKYNFHQVKGAVPLIVEIQQLVKSSSSELHQSTPARRKNSVHLDNPAPIASLV